MNLIHRGKIGWLPLTLQDQVNERLRNGEKARALAGWLNSLPEVQSLLAMEFGGKPVREQNLSEWRKNGHQKWLRQQEAAESIKRISADGDALTGAAKGPLMDKMAAWLTARYLVAARKLAGQGQETPSWERLRELCNDLVALRRGEHQAQRLDFEREKVRAGLAMGGQLPTWFKDLADTGMAMTPETKGNE